MALYLKEGSEESNIRGLVETCAHNDDITPLAKLVFEAQALADSPPSIAADGQTMVSIICGALRSVAADQGAVLDDVCHSNATAIATTVAELEHMAARVDEVKATLLGGNAAMQAAGSALVANAQHVSQLAEVQDNLGQAAAAVTAAQGVLEQCLAAGELIGRAQLYPALCMLDKIRRKHLATLLSIMSAAKQQQPGSGGSGSGGGSDPPPGGGHFKSRGVMSGRDLEHLAQLHAFFSSLVDDLSASVQQLAMKGFNAWLVEMRACARGAGMAAIQAAAVERSLDESLAAERKALLAALSGPGTKSVREIAAELGQAPFRQELLKAAADEAATQAAAMGATKPGGSSGGALSGGGSGGGSAASGGGAAADTRRSGGGSFTAASQSLRELLKRPSQRDKMPAALAAAAAAAAAAAEQQAAAAPREADELPQDMEDLHPGEPEAAIRAILEHKRRTLQAVGRSSSVVAAFARQRQQEQAQQQLPAAHEAPRALSSLLQLDMSGLYTALHVAKSLGQLDAFRAHYLDQRQLQISADLQPPSNFLQSHQAYLAQVTGFFVLEAFVQRASDDLVGPQEAAQLWNSALRSLKLALEGAFESQLSSGPLMLMVKDFVVLCCVALERTGHQVAPLTEAMQATCGRYHDLLAAQLQAQLAAVVDADVLGELEVRTREQHAALVAEYDLPWQLEGAAPPGRRAQLGPDGVPPLPYTAPFTASVPEVLGLVRRFVKDSLAYLRGLYSPWELLPAVFHQRDRMLSRVLVEVLAAKARTVGSAEMLRESMKCAANAWALSVALDGLDDWTITQARPDVGQPEQPAPASGKDALASPSKAQPAAAKLSRARNRKAVLASGALTNTVQAALKALQESSERDVLRGLTSRIEQLLEASHKGDWLPAEPLPAANSPWVNGLLSCMQETFDAGVRILPRSAVVSIMRRALRAAGHSAMRAFGPPTGVKAFNAYALEKLAANLAAVERFASRWGVATLEEELAEPKQLCQLLLSGQLDAYVASPELQRQRYAALDVAAVAAALDRFKEVPGQAKKRPDWPTKRAADAAAKALRAQMAAAAAAAAAGAAGAAAARPSSPQAAKLAAA